MGCLNGKPAAEQAVAEDAGTMQSNPLAAAQNGAALCGEAAHSGGATLHGGVAVHGGSAVRGGAADTQRGRSYAAQLRPTLFMVRFLYVYIYVCVKFNMYIYMYIYIYIYLT